jgi:hypothetical protein
VPLDLVDAVIAQLESVPAVQNAFGDTWATLGPPNGVSKFFTDIADQVPPPWCVISEVGETYEFMTAQMGDLIAFTAPGQLTFSIWAPDRYQARQLGLVCYKALNDHPLVWPAQSLMQFRMMQSSFVPNTSTGPGVPIMFNRIFVFEYMYSGSL